MIVGADDSNDSTILTKSSQLYQSFKMRRVYYSAFSPIPDASRQLPLKPPPLMREHRLYQADWLLRFYGFELKELTNTTDNAASKGMLALDVDPKLSWSMQNLHHFPVDLNTADYEMILRVPGIGLINARKILSQRKVRKIRYADLTRLRLQIDKVKLFVETTDYHPAPGLLEPTALQQRFTKKEHTQLSLF